MLNEQPAPTAAPEVGERPDNRLIFSLLLNALITVMQMVGGIFANSLGLLSDAAHNLSDVVALALSLWAVRLGRRPATSTRTFAFKRAEILVALFNSTVLVAVSIFLIVEAIGRILSPQNVSGQWVMVFAGAGLIINAVSALALRSHLQDLNLRSAFLHLVGDAMTSVAVILSGAIVYFWGWSYADPAVSILVSLWIVRAAFGIIRSAVNVLMEGTPEGIGLDEVEKAMLSVPGVVSIHDVHVWSISSNDHAMSAHVELADTALSETGAVLTTVKERLAHEFGIGHATLEAESTGSECAGGTCDLSARSLGNKNPHAGHSHFGHSH